MLPKLDIQSPLHAENRPDFFHQVGICQLCTSSWTSRPWMFWRTWYSWWNADNFDKRSKNHYHIQWAKLLIFGVALMVHWWYGHGFFFEKTRCYIDETMTTSMELFEHQYSLHSTGFQNIDFPVNIHAWLTSHCWFSSFKMKMKVVDRNYLQDQRSS